MKPLADVQRQVLTTVPALEAVEVAADAALGLVLATDVTAPEPVPPFTNSAMDGYAVRASDTASAPVTLVAAETVAAGSVAAGRVEPGTAIKIMTGAPLPEGADAVVQVENTRVDGDGVRIMQSVEPGTAVRTAGMDIAAGETVFAAGTRLTPAHLAVLASLGVVRPRVRRRPRVAVIATGDELRPADTGRLAPGQIRNSNGPLLVQLLAELGAEVVDLGIAGDDERALIATLAEAADAADVILTSGGVSMGDYEPVKAALERIGGFSLLKVAMQPAKPFAFGLHGDTPLFGLPGNPVSVMVAFEQFARPALLHMMGARRLFRPRVEGEMGEAVATDPAKEVFLRVVLRVEAGRLVAVPAGGQHSNQLAALARADAFAVVPVGTADVAAGEGVALELFRAAEARTFEEALGS